MFFSKPAESGSGYRRVSFLNEPDLQNALPQYIQYFPFILASTSLPLTILVIMEADLLAVSRNRPL
jgi:hypothetical protein